MYSIGQFSHLTGITTKALIWYDKIGVLKPIKINEENGYRYYDESSLQRVFQIKYLRSLDFTIDEIKRLSKEVLDNKIAQLKEKENFILANIDFLEKLKENNMEKDFFEIAEKMLNGKWVYAGSTTNFKDAQTMGFDGECKKDMPKYLFFGEHSLGTDLKEVFGYSSNLFTINGKTYHAFLLNYYGTLVLYENNADSKKRLYLHVYKRWSQTAYYTNENILTIQKKHKVSPDSESIPFNENLLGKWKIVDYIYESEIKDYNGKIKKKKITYFLSPLFDKLEIKDKNIVYVLGEDDVLKITYEKGIKIFNRDNTIMKIKMDNSSVENEKFYIVNHLNDQNLKGEYKRIGNSEYLFVNIDNIPDLDEKIYVYKKVKETNKKMKVQS